MANNRIAVATPGEASQPDAIKAAFAEFFSMLIFVFAGEGSGMAFSKDLNPNIFYFLIKIECLFSCNYAFRKLHRTVHSNIIYIIASN